MYRDSTVHYFTQKNQFCVPLLTVTPKFLISHFLKLQFLLANWAQIRWVNVYLTISRHKLAHSRRNSSTSLHELNLRDDDVVLQNRTTAGTHCAAPGLVHINIWPPAGPAYPGAHGQRSMQSGGQRGEDQKSTQSTGQTGGGGKRSTRPGGQRGGGQGSTQPGGRRSTHPAVRGGGGR